MNRSIITSLPQISQGAGKWLTADSSFDRLYPLSIQSLSQRHWTPLYVAGKAADFLASENSSRILDIGSGVGKFCLTAAFIKPWAFFTGVEQRQDLIKHAERAKVILGLENVSFINANFTQLDFRIYDHFYFYNSFYENLKGTDKIDDSIEYSSELFHYYNRYLYKLLEEKPSGTKLAAFHSLEDEMPADYELVNVDAGGFLKFWIKS